jgi:FAD/FMN-containing dehydrogenase
VASHFPRNLTFTDNGHLEECLMEAAAVNRDLTGLEQAVKNAQRVTAYGRRHTQGGQSLQTGSRAVEMDCLHEVEIHREGAGAYMVVDGGATWDHVHKRLAAYKDARFAPRTHQSSPFFSVGGSLAVNCHGRDPRQAPIAESVRSIWLMNHLGAVNEYRRPPGGTAPAELRLALGGYGAGGMIVKAELDLKPETQLRVVDGYKTLDGYGRWIREKVQPNMVFPLHHFVHFRVGTGEDLFEEGFITEAVDLGPAKGDEALQDDGLLTDDLLSVIYRKYRLSKLEDRGETWRMMQKQILEMKRSTLRQLNAMRDPVRFTQSRPWRDDRDPTGPRRVDLMQEYFVPPDKFVDFVRRAKGIVDCAQQAGTLEMLTCTARVVQQDSTSMLNYAPGLRMCFVINFSTPLGLARTFDDDTNPLTVAMRELITAAIDAGGSYYLCYGRFAAKAQFEAAYGKAAIDSFKGWRRHLDPGYKFGNRFLDHYLTA